MSYYLVIFAAGFAGSFHCIGMCGGFACALGRDPRGTRATAIRHLLYNTGRLTTYCFLGGLAGALGQVISTPHGVAAVTPLLGGSIDFAQRGLAIIAGLLMIAMALQFFGVLKIFHRLAGGFAGSTLAMALRALLTARSNGAPLAFGVFNGFLPCPLVYAFVAQAASSAEASSGVLTMAAFGLGTFPAMPDDGRCRVSSSGRNGDGVVSGWPVSLFFYSASSRLAAVCCRWTCISTMPGWEGFPHDVAAQPCAVQSLLAAGRPTADAPPYQWRGVWVLLLRLLHRLSGQERPERGVGGRLAADPPRRRRLSLHEHHDVLPAALFRRVHRCGCGGTAVGSSGALGLRHAGGDHSRRTLFARNVERCHSAAGSRPRPSSCLASPPPIFIRQSRCLRAARMSISTPPRWC